MSGSEAFVAPTGAQNMRLTFSSDGSAVYKPIASTSPSYQPPTAAGNGSGIEGSAGVGGSGGGAPLPHGLNMNMSGESPKRKRGRPRKYGPDGTMSLALSPAVQVVIPPSNAGFSSQPAAVAAGAGAAVPPSGGSASPTSAKKSRGRPPGSGSGRKRQLETLGSVGIGFTPHVITVKAGEDVASKIMSFSQNGPRAVCILSANGAISNVTLRQPAVSGGTVTYEGRFEILSLSGSFLLSENEGPRSRTGGLSVSLSGSDGRVLGGGVAGLLTAASPVQVVVGSFVSDGRKEPKPSKHADPFSSPTALAQGGGLTGGSSPSHGTLSESSGGPGSPLNQSTGACNNSNPQAMSSIPWK